MLMTAYTGRLFHVSVLARKYCGVAMEQGTLLLESGTVRQRQATQAMKLSVNSAHQGNSDVESCTSIDLHHRLRP